MTRSLPMRGLSVLQSPRPQRRALTSTDAQPDAEKRRRDQGDGKCSDEREHSLLTSLLHPAKPLLEEIFTITRRQ